MVKFIDAHLYDSSMAAEILRVNSGSPNVAS